MVLSDVAIAEAARRAGFKGNDLVVAVAVAIAESGGDTTAHNDSEPDGSESFGLWQINSVHKSLLDSGDWRNPDDNARMAFVVWQMQGWTAWGVFNNQSYLLRMPRAQSAVAQIGQSDTGQTQLIGLNPLDNVTAVLGRLGDFLAFITDRQNWLRVLMVVVGVSMLSIVVIQVVRSSSTLQRVGQIAGTAVTRGVAK